MVCLQFNNIDKKKTNTGNSSNPQHPNPSEKFKQILRDTLLCSLVCIYLINPPFDVVLAIVWISSILLFLSTNFTIGDEMYENEDPWNECMCDICCIGIHGAALYVLIEDYIDKKKEELKNNEKLSFQKYHMFLRFSEEFLKRLKNIVFENEFDSKDEEQLLTVLGYLENLVDPDLVHISINTVNDHITVELWEESDRIMNIVFGEDLEKDNYILTFSIDQGHVGKSLNQKLKE